MEPFLTHADLVMPTECLLTRLANFMRDLQASELFQLSSGRWRILPGIFLIDFEQDPINLSSTTLLIVRRVILLVVVVG